MVSVGAKQTEIFSVCLNPHMSMGLVGALEQIKGVLNGLEENRRVPYV